MTIVPPSILWYALVVPSGLILTTVLLLIPIATLLLAIVTTVRQYLTAKPLSSYKTAIYRGRVSHTRYRPATHSFSYPLFFCVLDLSEVDDLFGNGSSSNAALWPLSLLMQFRESDHLKNGEGLMLVDGANGGKTVADEAAAAADNTTRARICRLVAERTKGKCRRPTQSQRIFLITHLSYYFYCFNPVSFYYILKEGSDDVDAIVAEVSNTPWNEMQCYVLHPDSVDIDVVKAGRPRTVRAEDKSVSKFPRADEDSADAVDGTDSDKWLSINYIFQKAFHVSPFMTMDHKYDWTFWQPRSDRIAVSTSMIREGVPYFNAYFDIRRQPFTPLRLCYQLIRMPFYCVIIQIWIHIEAFWLFMKGVEFIPHPKGSETASSKAIAQIMSPFFLAKDWLCNRREKSE